MVVELSVGNVAVNLATGEFHRSIFLRCRESVTQIDDADLLKARYRNLEVRVD